MRPLSWHPSIEPSAGEQTVLRRSKKANLCVFVREHRHEIFTDEFQEELGCSYKDSAL